MRLSDKKRLYLHLHKNYDVILGTVVTYGVGLILTKSYDPELGSRMYHVNNLKSSISFSTRPLTIKFDRVVTEDDSFFTWSREASCQIKNVVSPFHKTYGHRNFIYLGLGWGAPGCQVILTFEYKIPCQMKNSDNDSGSDSEYQTWLREDLQRNVMWPNYAKCSAEI